MNIRREVQQRNGVRVLQGVVVSRGYEVYKVEQRPGFRILPGGKHKFCLRTWFYGKRNADGVVGWYFSH